MQSPIHPSPTHPSSQFPLTWPALPFFLGQLFRPQRLPVCSIQCWISFGNKKKDMMNFCTYIAPMPHHVCAQLGQSLSSQCQCPTFLYQFCSAEPQERGSRQSPLHAPFLFLVFWGKWEMRYFTPSEAATVTWTFSLTLCSVTICCTTH